MASRGFVYCAGSDGLQRDARRLEEERRRLSAQVRRSERGAQAITKVAGLMVGLADTVAREAAEAAQRDPVEQDV